MSPAIFCRTVHKEFALLLRGRRLKGGLRISLLESNRIL